MFELITQTGLGSCVLLAVALAYIMVTFARGGDQ